MINLPGIFKQLIQMVMELLSLVLLAQLILNALGLPLKQRYTF
jgi:hypothetical protein